jgi:hypothetical protein
VDSDRSNSLWLVDMLKARCLRDVLNLSSASQRYSLQLQKSFREKQQKKGLDNVVKRTQNQITRTAKWTRELKGEHGEELAPEEEEYIEVAKPESPLPKQ